MKAYLAKLADDYEAAMETLCSPSGNAGQDKVRGRLKPGATCAWCYADDVEYWRKNGEDYPYPSRWPYQGFIMPFPDTDGRTKDMEPEHVCVVVVDYPIEKENPVTDWGTLANLIADPKLHRFYVFAEIKPQSHD